MTNQEKAKQYVDAVGNIDTAIKEINVVVMGVELSHPNDESLESSKGYKSVTDVRDEIYKLKKEGYTP